MGRLRSASPAHRGDPCMCWSPIARPSTSPAVTWRSAQPTSRRSVGSIPGSERPATTSTCAGGCRIAAGRSASTRPPWCGTTVAIRCAPTGGNRSATAGRRRCSSANGRRSTTTLGTSAGRAGCTAADCPTSWGGGAPAWITASGARRRPGPLWPVTGAVWSEHWLDQDQRLRAMETDLRAGGVCALRGGRDGRWDLEVRGGSFGAARLLMGVEEHAGGKQLIRVRWWPVMPAAGPLLTLVFTVLTGGALDDQAWVAAAVLGFGALLFAARAVAQCSAATATIREIVDRLRRSELL